MLAPCEEWETNEKAARREWKGSAGVGACVRVEEGGHADDPKKKSKKNDGALGDDPAVAP